MNTQKEFNDPLSDIDPIMEKAFSISDDQEKMTKSAMEDIAKETPSLAEIQFPNLNPEESDKKPEADIFGNIPVTLSVELGRSQISLKEVFELSEGAIIELERLVGEPLDLVVNGQTIAQGEVVAIDNNYGFRVTNITSKAQNK